MAKKKRPFGWTGGDTRSKEVQEQYSPPKRMKLNALANGVLPSEYTGGQNARVMAREESIARARRHRENQDREARAVKLRSAAHAMNEMAKKLRAEERRALKEALEQQERDERADLRRLTIRERRAARIKDRGVALSHVDPAHVILVEIIRATMRNPSETSAPLSLAFVDNLVRRGVLDPVTSTFHLTSEYRVVSREVVKIISKIVVFGDGLGLLDVLVQPRRGGKGKAPACVVATNELSRKTLERWDDPDSDAPYCRSSVRV